MERDAATAAKLTELGLVLLPRQRGDSKRGLTKRWCGCGERGASEGARRSACVCGGGFGTFKKIVAYRCNIVNRAQIEEARDGAPLVYRHGLFSDYTTEQHACRVE